MRGCFSSILPDGLFARKYKDPVLVSCTDGVGTKLKVAQLAGVHDTVGIDLVAMCVNDALCCGAEPLFFLDYVAMAHDDPGAAGGDRPGHQRRLRRRATWRSSAARRRSCPICTRRATTTWPASASASSSATKVIDGSTISPGDVVLGVASSGLHSNGYSLVRKIVFDIAGLDVERPCLKRCGATVGEVLLTPTPIYARAVRSVLAHYKVKSVVHGIAHITGGGLHENLDRILPPGVGVTIDRGSWPVPPVFTWLQKLGDVDDDEMDRVFNMGVGLALVVSPYYAESIQQQLSTSGLASWLIGRVMEGNQQVAWA